MDERYSVFRFFKNCRLAVVAVFVSALAVMAIGCGGGDDGASADKGSGSDGASADVELAKKEIEPHLERPTEIPVKEPIKSDIPKGKEIYFLACDTPGCIVIADAFEEAAETLGWKATVLNAGIAPETIKAAWAQAARAKPDGVVAIGHSRELFAPELKELEAEGIPVVECCVPEEATDGVEVIVNDSLFRYGELMASFVIADTDGKANTLYVDLPAFPTLATLKKGFMKRYSERCPSCELETLRIPAAAIGKDVPDRIVSALRANPDINYVAISDDVMTLGVPGALQDAGLADQVEIIGDTAGLQNLGYIASGGQRASIPAQSWLLAYQMADALARSFAGESVEPSTAHLPIMILTQDNLVKDDELFPLVEDYKEQYAELWGVEATE